MPVAVAPGVDDGLDAVAPFRADDDPAVPERHPRAHQLGTVAGRVAQEGGVPARRGGEPHEVARPRRRARLERDHDVHAVVVQLCRKRERERPAPGEDDALAGHHALRLHDRLRRAGRQHPRQRPAGEHDRPVVRAGRKQDAPRVNGPRVLTFFDEDDGRAANRDRARARHQPRIRAGRLGDQPPPAEVVATERAGLPNAEPNAELLVDLSAEGRTLVDEADGEAGCGSLDDGREPRRSAADDEQVVGLFGFCAHGRPS